MTDAPTPTLSAVVAQYATYLTEQLLWAYEREPGRYADVRSWTDLHDVCDANEFVLMCSEEFGIEWETAEDLAEIDEAIPVVELLLWNPITLALNAYRNILLVNDTVRDVVDAIDNDDLPEIAFEVVEHAEHNEIDLPDDALTMIYDRLPAFADGLRREATDLIDIVLDEHPEAEMCWAGHFDPDSFIITDPRAQIVATLNRPGIWMIGIYEGHDGYSEGGDSPDVTADIRGRENVLTFLNDLLNLHPEETDFVAWADVWIRDAETDGRILGLVSDESSPVAS